MQTFLLIATILTSELKQMRKFWWKAWSVMLIGFYKCYQCLKKAVKMSPDDWTRQEPWATWQRPQTKEGAGVELTLRLPPKWPFLIVSLFFVHFKRFSSHFSDVSHRFLFYRFWHFWHKHQKWIVHNCLVSKNVYRIKK